MLKKQTTIILLLLTTLLFSHGGGLDSNGGHTNRKTGTYHYHRKPKKKPVSNTRVKITHTVNSNSGIRHNSSCRYFDCYNCQPADSLDGIRACKICGG